MIEQRNISEYNKEYRLNHKEYFMVKNKEHHIVNKENISERKRKYYLENCEKIRERKRKYYLENKERLNKQSVVHVNKRKNDDNLFKLTCNIRGLIHSTLKLDGYRKTSKTQNILGCTFEEFKMYLESKFEPWMNWSNYGNWNGEPKEINAAWDIDHIIPISIAKTEEMALKLSHHTNFQPLCSYTNRHIKRDNIIDSVDVFILNGNN